MVIAKQQGCSNENLMIASMRKGLGRGFRMYTGTIYFKRVFQLC